MQAGRQGGKSSIQLGVSCALTTRGDAKHAEHWRSCGEGLSRNLAIGFSHVCTQTGRSMHRRSAAPAGCAVHLQHIKTATTCALFPNAPASAAVAIIIIPCKPYLSASATTPHPLGRQKVERLFSLFSAAVAVRTLAAYAASPLAAPAVPAAASAHLNHDAQL
jgi:hypothetical protein